MVLFHVMIVIIIIIMESWNGLDFRWMMNVAFDQEVFGFAQSDGSRRQSRALDTDTP